MLYTSPNSDTWTAVPGTQFGDQALEAMAFGDGTYMTAALTAGPQDASGTSTTTFYTSTDAKTWKSVSERPSFISTLAYGPAPVSSAGNTTPTTVLTTGTPTCKSEYMWTAIKHAIAADAIPNIPSITAHCSGEWGYTQFGMMTGGTTLFTLPVHYDSKTRLWEAAPDACAKDQLPADIKGDACSGTIPDANNSAPQSPSATTTPTTAAAASNPTPPSCTNADFEPFVAASGGSILQLWCADGWAIVYSTTPYPGDMNAYVWNAESSSWDTTGFFHCEQVAGMPKSLYGQVCDHG
jgi:hypothetical protein